MRFTPVRYHPEVDRRTLRRTLQPLLLAIALGASVALALHVALDRAATRRAERDLLRTMHLLEPELAALALSPDGAGTRVSQLGGLLGVRVTLMAGDGKVLADSAVDASHLPSVENHAGRPEVVAAGRDGVGFDRRRSATVSVPYLYVARRLGSPSRPTGFLRFAVSPSELAAAERPFRRAADLVAALAGLAAGAALLLARLRHARELFAVQQAVAAAARGDEADAPAGVSDETADVLLALHDFARLVRLEREGSRGVQELAEKVFAGVPVGLVLLERSGRVAAANPAFLGLVGAPGPVPGGGIPLVELVRSAELSDPLSRGLAGEPVEREAIRLDRAGSPPSVVEVSVFALASSQAGAPAALGVVRDATERHRLEGLRRRFVADVSHELRTPVASIRAAAETLEEEAAASEETRRLAAIVSRNAAGAEALLDELTDLSLIESGGIALKAEPVEVAGLLEDVRDDLLPEAARRGIDVAVDAPAGLSLLGDRRRIGQVLRNLLDNALKFSPRGSRVDLGAGRGPGPGQVFVEVRDRGIGIPAAERENVFQRFYRVDPSRSKTVPGSGLGLAIVKHLVLLHGGTVSVEGAAGEGTCVRVTLPQARGGGNVTGADA